VPGPFADLRAFLRFLESRGQLKRVRAEVDPVHEITEIMCRVVKQQGPAVLFENVKGSSFPLLINMFGTAERIAWALGRTPAEVGREIQGFALDMMPPKFGALWRHRGLLKRVLAMKPRRAAGGPVFDVIEPPDLDRLPVLKCWPDDGGRFITYPLVLTKNPATGHRNLGIYRIHVYDKTRTGMHWQIQKGGGFHYARAEEKNEALPAAVILGADPLLMLAGVLPLPEDVDEIAFAGFLKGAPLSLSPAAGAGVEIPSDAEMVFVGRVPPKERRMEGPFGDHFGHYSHAAPFPVFEAKTFYRRKDAIFPAAVVGKPPQEDKFMGNAVQEMLLPLLKVMKPELTDLWSYFEAGFHNLAVASVKQRYAKEAVKTALGLLGEGQMSLTKCLILVDPDVDVKNFSAVLDALRTNFDPKDDFMLLPGTAQDTLDFTSFRMNLGSKMILDATSLGGPAALVRRRAPDTWGAGGAEPGRIAVGGLGPEVVGHRNWQDALLVVKVREGGRAVVERLVKDPGLAGFRLVMAVSEDVPLDDEELLLWGLFTRFDCARDVVPSKATFRGGWPVYEGPLGFDATWKEGYPKPVAMDPSVVQQVDRRWGDYGIL